MDQKALFLKLWEKEAPATRKVLSRIPDDSAYRPDPKSRTAKEIAWLIVREEMVLIAGLENGQLEWDEIPAPATMKEVLAAYDRHRQGLPERFQAIESPRWEKPVPFLFGGQARGPFFDLVESPLGARALALVHPRFYPMLADELAVVVVPLPLQHIELFRSDGHEQRRRVRGDPPYHRAVARLETVGNPDDVLARGLFLQPRFHFREELDVFRQLLAAVPIVQALETDPELVFLHGIEIEIFVRLVCRQRIEMGVAHLHHRATGDEPDQNEQRRKSQNSHVMHASS